LIAALALSAPVSVAAQPRGKPRPAAAKKATKPVKKADADADKNAAESKSDDSAPDDKATPELPDKGEPSAVKAAGTSAATKATPTGAVSVKETKEGVKSYKFGTIEVEGRSKSPEIIYFLRRVRAEFDAGALGHRSFMRELSDTRNRPSFR
jgi:hypothetical protein